MKFIDPSFKELHDTLRNNAKLEKFFISQKILIGMDEYYENYGYNNKNKESAYAIVREENEKVYDNITEVLLPNLDFIKENSISTLVAKQYLKSEIKFACGFGDDVILADDVIWEIYYCVKYCYTSSFFQNNWENFVPKYDFENMEENPALSAFMDSIMKEFDKLDHILDSFCDFRDYQKIPYDYIVYLTQLLGVEPKDFMIMKNQQAQYRYLAENIIDVYSVRGTASAFELLFNFLGYTFNVEEYFFDRRRYCSLSEANEETITNDVTSYKFYLTTKDPRHNLLSELGTNEIVNDNDISEKHNIRDFDELVKKYGLRCVLGYDDEYVIEHRSDDGEVVYSTEVKKYDGPVYKYFRTNYIRVRPFLKYSSGNFSLDQLYQVSALLNFMIPEFITRETYVVVDIGKNDDKLVLNWNRDEELDDFFMLDSETWEQNFADKYISNYYDNNREMGYLNSGYMILPFRKRDNGTEEVYVNSLGQTEHFSGGKRNNVFFNPVSEKIKIINTTKYWGDKVKIDSPSKARYPVYRITDNYTASGQKFYAPQFLDGKRQITELYMPKDAKFVTEREQELWDRLEKVGLNGFNGATIKNKQRDKSYGKYGYYNYNPPVPCSRRDVDLVIDGTLADFLRIDDYEGLTERDQKLKEYFFHKEWLKTDNYVWKYKFSFDVSNTEFLKGFVAKHRNVINYDYITGKLFCSPEFYNMSFSSNSDRLLIKNAYSTSPTDMNIIGTELVNNITDPFSYIITLDVTRKNYAVYQQVLINRFDALWFNKFRPVPMLTSYMDNTIDGRQNIIVFDQNQVPNFTFSSYKQMLDCMVDDVFIYSESFKKKVESSNDFVFFVSEDGIYYKLVRLPTTTKKVLHKNVNATVNTINLLDIDTKETLEKKLVGSFYMSSFKRYDEKSADEIADEIVVEVGDDKNEDYEKLYEEAVQKLAELDEIKSGLYDELYEARKTYGKIWNRYKIAGDEWEYFRVIAPFAEIAYNDPDYPGQDLKYSAIARRDASYSMFIENLSRNGYGYVFKILKTTGIPKSIIEEVGLAKADANNNITTTVPNIDMIRTRSEKAKKDYDEIGTEYNENRKIVEELEKKYNEARDNYNHYSDLVDDYKSKLGLEVEPKYRLINPEEWEAEDSDDEITSVIELSDGTLIGEPFLGEGEERKRLKQSIDGGKTWSELTESNFWLTPGQHTRLKKGADGTIYTAHYSEYNSSIYYADNEDVNNFKYTSMTNMYVNIELLSDGTIIGSDINGALYRITDLKKATCTETRLETPGDCELSNIVILDDDSIVLFVGDKRNEYYAENARAIISHDKGDTWEVGQKYSGDTNIGKARLYHSNGVLFKSSGYSIDGGITFNKTNYSYAGLSGIVSVGDGVFVAFRTPYDYDYLGDGKCRRSTYIFYSNNAAKTWIDTGVKIDNIIDDLSLTAQLSATKNKLFVSFTDADGLKKYSTKCITTHELVKNTDKPAENAYLNKLRKIAEESVGAEEVVEECRKKYEESVKTLDEYKIYYNYNEISAKYDAADEAYIKARDEYYELKGVLDGFYQIYENARKENIRLSRICELLESLSHEESHNYFGKILELYTRIVIDPYEIYNTGMGFDISKQNYLAAEWVEHYVPEDLLLEIGFIAKKSDGIFVMSEPDLNKGKALYDKSFVALSEASSAYDKACNELNQKIQELKTLYDEAIAECNKCWSALYETQQAIKPYQDQVDKDKKSYDDANWVWSNYNRAVEASNADNSSAAYKRELIDPKDWKVEDCDINIMSAIELPDGVVVAESGDGNGIIRSKDNGNSWYKLKDVSVPNKDGKMENFIKYSNDMVLIGHWAYGSNWSSGSLDYSYGGEGFASSGGLGYGRYMIGGLTEANNNTLFVKIYSSDWLLKIKDFQKTNPIIQTVYFLRNLDGEEVRQQSNVMVLKDGTIVLAAYFYNYIDGERICTIKMLISHDDGETWDVGYTVPIEDNNGYTSGAASGDLYCCNDILFSTHGGGIKYSLDAGKTFNKAIVPNANASYMITSVDDNMLVAVCITTNGLCYSDDGGKTWQDTGLNVGSDMNLSTYYPANIFKFKDGFVVSGPAYTTTNGSMVGAHMTTKYIKTHRLVEEQKPYDGARLSKIVDARTPKIFQYRYSNVKKNMLIYSKAEQKMYRINSTGAFHTDDTIKVNGYIFNKTERTVDQKGGTFGIEELNFYGRMVFEENNDESRAYIYEYDDQYPGFSEQDDDDNYIFNNFEREYVWKNMKIATENVKTFVDDAGTIQMAGEEYTRLTNKRPIKVNIDKIFEERDSKEFYQKKDENGNPIDDGALLNKNVLSSSILKEICDSYGSDYRQKDRIVLRD